VLASTNFAETPSIYPPVERVVPLSVKVSEPIESALFPLTSFNNAADAAGDQLRLFPNIIQGSNEGDRVGNSITIRDFTVMGHMTVQIPTLNPDVPRSRIMVRMLVCQPIAYGTYGSMGNISQLAWMNSVLREGNVPRTLDGSIKSMYLPPNADVVKVWHDKRVILRSDVIYPGTGATYQFATEFFKFTMPHKGKKVNYDGSGTETVGYAPILLMAYTFLDGSALSSLNTNVQLAYNATVKYEDV